MNYNNNCYYIVFVDVTVVSSGDTKYDLAGDSIEAFSCKYLVGYLSSSIHHNFSRVQQPIHHNYTDHNYYNQPWVLSDDGAIYS